MEVNEAAIASTIAQQVGSSRVRYIEEILMMAVPYCKVLRAIAAILTGCPTGLGKLQTCNFGVSKKTVIARVMHFSRLRPAGRI